MVHRRHGTKPTFALWTLIIATNLAVVVAGIGLLTALIIIGSFAAVAALGTGLWMYRRRQAAPSTESLTESATPAPIAVQPES
jgi:amino acid transporter